VLVVNPYNEVEMDGACNTRSGNEKCVLYSRENVKGRDHLEDVGIGSGTVYCKGYKKKGVLRS
jgi:hypothetical protein